MKAVVWRGDRTLDIETVEDARLEAPTDVLMRLTSTAICGTDLHIYEGRMTDPGTARSHPQTYWSDVAWRREHGRSELWHRCDWLSGARPR